MNKSSSAYLNPPTTTASPLLNRNSTNPGNETDGDPRVRARQDAASGPALIDAYRASFSDASNSASHVRPSPQQVHDALATASSTALYAMLRAAVSNLDYETTSDMDKMLRALPGDGEAARAALKSALNTVDGNGDTVLMSLLKNPSQKDARSKHKETLLDLCILPHDRKLADKEGNTAAMLAIKHKYPLRYVAMMLEESVIDHADHVGDTALNTAVAQRNEGLVEFLLKHGASPGLQTGQGKESALQQAWNDADYDNDSIREMLRKASAQDQLTHIAGPGAPASSCEERAFQAIRVGDMKTLERLLKKDRSILKAKTVSGHTLMMLAAIHGKLEIARFLCREKASRNAQAPSGDTALLYAIRHGHAHLASVLIDAGADVDCRNVNAYRPLPYAASKGMASTVAKLLEHDADIDSKMDNSNLLECAFESGSLETVQNIIAHLANSAAGREMLTSSFHACVFRSIRSKESTYLVRAEMLLDAGVDINSDSSVPAKGTTALMHLAEYADERRVGAMQMARMLIARGADSDCRNAKGKTALDIAKEQHYQPMIDLLSGNAAPTSSTSSSSSTSSTSSSPAFTS